MTIRVLLADDHTLMREGLRALLATTTDIEVAGEVCTGREAERAMEHAGVRVSIENLRTFPCIRSKERSGKLRLRGAFFAIADGVLHVLDEPSGEFRPVE